MIVDDMKVRIKDAMKGKRDVERDILRLMVGTYDSQQAVAGSRTFGDTEMVAIVKKSLEGIKESLQHARDEQKPRLEEEMKLLKEFVPQTLGTEQIKERLEPLRDELRGMKGEGQAVGRAMKLFKESGDAVNGNDVKAVVTELRS